MKDLLEYLSKNGWREFPTYPPTKPEKMHKLFCKQLLGLTRCYNNPDKAIQVCLNFTQIDINGVVTDMVTVYIRGQVGEETWYTMEAYSMSPECFIRTNEEVIYKLGKAWEALHV